MENLLTTIVVLFFFYLFGVKNTVVATLIGAMLYLFGFAAAVKMTAICYVSASAVTMAVITGGILFDYYKGGKKMTRGMLTFSSPYWAIRSLITNKWEWVDSHTVLGRIGAVALVFFFIVPLYLPLFLSSKHSEIWEEEPLNPSINARLS